MDTFKVEIDYGGCEVRLLESGDVQFIWKSNPLGRINEATIKSVGFLYRSRDEIKNGAGLSATAFLVAVSEPNASQADKQLPLGFRHAYVVTAAHVVKQGFTVLRIATTSGEFKVFDLPKTAKHQWNPGDVAGDIWRRHDEGHDLAVYPLPIFPNTFNAINVEDFATTDVIQELSLGAGDDVFMPGRLWALSGLEDPPPVVRFGKIAAMPDVLVPNPTIEEGMAQPSFLVELRSDNGYSGAPVLVSRAAPKRISEDDSVALNERIWLLGVNWGHVPMTHPDDWRLRSNPHIAMVIPAEKVLEILRYDDLEKRRNAVWEAHKKRINNLPPGVPDIG